MIRFSSFIHICLVVSFVLCSTAQFQRAHADSSPSILSTESGRSLAQDFLSRLKPVFQNKKSPPPKSKDKIFSDQLAKIPDGQDLLLEGQVDIYTYDEGLLSIKENGALYFSVLDLAAVLDLALEIVEEGTAVKGWFLREDWTFDLDTKTNQVVTRGKEYSFTEQEVIARDGDVYIRMDLLPEWLGLTFDVTPSTQIAKIESEWILPGIASLQRRDRENRERAKRNKPDLPPASKDKKIFALNTLQSTLRANYISRGQTDTTFQDYVLNNVAQGQILDQDARLLTTRTKRDGFDRAFFTVSKRTKEPEMLGPLNARFYEAGDIIGTLLPLTGQQRNDLGVRVTNNTMNRVGGLTTVIQGDALPGWDVELFRNGGLLEAGFVGQDGRYRFEDIPLFSGDNDFEVVFYGPQGEIRSEVLNIPLSQDILSAQENVYDVSLQVRDTETYQKRPFERPDSRTIDATGRYNFFVGDALAYVGGRFQTVEILQQAEEENILTTGFTTPLGAAFLEANFAADLAGEFASQLLATYPLTDWINLNTNLELRTDAFGPEETDTPTTQRYNLTGNFDLGNGLLNNQRFLAAYRYSETANGSSAKSYEFQLSGSYKRLGITNQTLLETFETPNGETFENVLNSTFLRGRYAGFNWRAGVVYQFEPLGDVQAYQADLNYRYSDKISGRLGVNHNPAVGLTTGNLQVNWMHDNFNLTPQLSYDSEQNLFAGLTLRVGLIDVPDSRIPEFVGEPVLGRSSVSAFVFFDKNGNQIFDEGDEPLPDVSVIAEQASRNGVTDETGFALVQGIREYVETDIQIDTDTLPDPFMVSMFPGNSILARPGSVYKFEFPVQMAGEADGYIRVRKPDGDIAAGGFADLQIFPLDPPYIRPEQITAASDGFYIIPDLYPGRYFITVTEEDARAFGAARPPPTLLTIGHEGTIVSGQNMELVQGQEDISFTVLSPEDIAALGVPPVENPKEAPPVFFIQIGQTQSSKLLDTLFKYRAKNEVAALLSDMFRLSTSDNESGEVTERYIVPDHSIEEAYQRCRALVAYNISCQVEAGIRPQAKPVEPSKQVKAFTETGSEAQQL